MSIKTVPQSLYSPDLAPCDFWLFPKLRVCRYETIEEMKEAVTKVIATLTRGLPWSLPEVVGTVQQVHCRGRDYFEGDKCFMCVLTIKVPIRKSLETYLMILVSGRNHQEPNQPLKSVLQRIKTAGATLNDKCIFSVRNMKFLGHIITKKGIQFV